MNFLYADVLKTKFGVFGHFYNIRIGNKIFNCRSSLEIVSRSINQAAGEPADAVVVMMNPGSSVPLDKRYKPKLYSQGEVCSPRWEKESIPTRPDNAQYQIMRLMLLNDWGYVKVLNLSDLRNGNSGKFSSEFEEASRLDASNPHCVTHEERRPELAQSLKTKRNGPVIAAWGSVKVLRESAKKLIELEPGIIGLKLDDPWYKYASPYMKDKKLDWLEKMDLLVKKHDKPISSNHA